MLPQFDPLVSEWFSTRFGAATEPQLQGWPAIRNARDTLISAPTGSGKTLAAFLVSIDALIRLARLGPLPGHTHVVYVSPLKALSNDVHVNLEVPLAEISTLAASKGIALAPIRTALRTGDTPQSERARMTRECPHILVTTPESLYILLTATRPREFLGCVDTVIVDEIHAVAGNKRGGHLSLTLARLDRLVESNGRPKPQRIGLSATVKPIEDVAAFLAPDVHIVDIGHRRDMDVAIETAQDELGPIASNEIWDDAYDRLADLIRANRTTLVFVNTRRLAERVSHHLAARLGENAVLPHHGSLSRALRLDAEKRLKAGHLRAVVATASLELGIDIGSVDLVCQIGSPRSIAISLQRIGRSGHWVGALPKGRLFAYTRDELIESAALVRAIRSGELDRLEIPRNALDILAQQIVAACANEEFGEDDLFDFVRRAFPYRTLPRADFDAVLETLSEGIVTSRGHAGAFLHRDAVNRRIRARRHARISAITNGGAIPETGQYLVVAEPEGAVVGSLDEDFAIESMAGDVFYLGATSWRIRRVESGRVRVEAAPGAPPTIPFWNGEAPGRTFELSLAVSRLREDIAANPTPDWLMRDCGLSRAAAEQAVAYVQAGAAALGAMPTANCVVAERFFDEGGGMQLIIHAPFGARINRAWGLALRKRFCRSFNFELQAAATDNGINISLGEQHSFPLEAVFEFLRPETCEEVLTQAMLPAPMFGARWRWNATRALAIPRFQNGKKVPPPIQRMRADDLMAAVFPDQAACPENLAGEVRIPNHPYVKETIANCLHEALDLNRMREVIASIRQGRIRTHAIDTPEPSPFSHEILNANPYAYLDDAPLEERRARAVQLRSTLRTDFADGAGSLDPAAIDQVAAEAWPTIRDADELHEALTGFFLYNPQADLEIFYTQLAAARRVATLTVDAKSFWVPAERVDYLRRVYPNAAIDPPLAAPAGTRPAPESPEACAAEIVRGWFECSGPLTAAALSLNLAMPRDLVDQALLQLEAEGQILRGRFTADLPPRLSVSASNSQPPRSPEPPLEWCHRRILARIHRLTLGRLRREIEPVTTSQFFAFLHRWQHLVPGTQLHGVDGTLQIVRQLQGCEFPAAVWESEVLPRRIANYKPEYLDQLCLSGEISWGRVSPHPAFDREEAERNGRRVRPTRVAPLTIFLREDAPWILAASPPAPGTLTEASREILLQLESRGACFFADLQRTTARTTAEVEDALWELVAAGLVTADGFENLRALLDPKRRGRASRPRHAAGRWCLFQHADTRPADAAASFARQLLARWGIVFRDVAVRETNAPPWRELLIELRRMEARGEIRGGRFVSAFLGEQFARPEALDALRAIHRASAHHNGPAQLLTSPADPLAAAAFPPAAEPALAAQDPLAAIPSPAALLWPPHDSRVADLLLPTSASTV